jgi:tetratricopeptide (TPR) repeat protein
LDLRQYFHLHPMHSWVGMLKYKRFISLMTLATDHELRTDNESKRRLILRDGLNFLILTLITAVLLAITLFLFRSFTSHREELAERWSARGQAAISARQPEQAITALRTALFYAPGNRSYELLLAEALGDAGHTEESYNYFLGLWETQPGDGFINLRLARLAAAKKDTQAAINYYRASLYGTWEGDGTERRRDVRLELSRYLIAQHKLSNARAELLVAGNNAPNDASLALTLAQLLEQAEAPRDALNYYQKVLAQEPNNPTALEAAGRQQYQFGNFEDAHRLLEQAVRERTLTSSNQAALPAETTAMLNASAQIIALAPIEKLPPAERVARVLKARDLAKRRFETCKIQASAASQLPSPLQALGAQWIGKEASINRIALLNNFREEAAVVKLVYDTELQTNQICGAPTGDDALLLLLAQSSKTAEP